MHRNFWQLSTILVLLCLLGACQREVNQGQQQPPQAEVLEPTQELLFTRVVSSQVTPVVLHGSDYLLLASEVRGLVLLQVDGSEALALDGGSVERFAAQPQADGSWLIAAFDEYAGEIQLRRLSYDTAAGQPALNYLGALHTAAPQVALCFSRQAQRTHLFAIDEEGLGREYIVHPREQAWQFSEVRPLYFGQQVSSCVVDDQRGHLLVAQPPLGIWSLNASAEEDENRSVFAMGGALGEDFGGFWLHESTGQLWLASGDRVQAYNLTAPQQAPVFSRQLASIEPVSVALLGDDLLALAEESNSLQRFALELPQAAAEIQTLISPQEIPVVAARAQTEPVDSAGDAADDPAIWVNIRDVSASLLLGTDKKGGLNVYALDGKLQQQIAVGRVNNVDLRPLQHPRYAALAATSNRTTAGVNLFGITPGGNVEHLGLRELEMGDPYGLCMYRNDGKSFVWVSDKDAGLNLLEIELGADALEWQLHPRAQVEVTSQVEGCVVDDERGTLFFGEEDSGVWRLDIARFLTGQAEPELVAAVDGRQLVADVEGMGLYHGESRSYLVVSSQGNNSYALFSRDGSEFIGHFRVDVNLGLGLDGSSETDGLEVTSAALGADYPAGLLIVQDGRNRMPSAAQNFKLVSWADIAERLQLP